MKREAGFYWVLDEHIWVVAEWDTQLYPEGVWFYPGLDLPYKDGDFVEIGERVTR